MSYPSLFLSLRYMYSIPLFPYIQDISISPDATSDYPEVIAAVPGYPPGDTGLDFHSEFVLLYPEHA